MQSEYADYVILRNSSSEQNDASVLFSKYNDFLIVFVIFSSIHLCSISQKMSFFVTFFNLPSYFVVQKTHLLYNHSQSEVDITGCTKGYAISAFRKP